MMLSRFAFLALFLFGLGQLNAQTLRGRILDDVTGEGLAGASIVIIDNQNGTTSDESGNYRFDNLKAGIYQVEFRFLGYSPLIIAEVEVVAGSERILDVKLKKSTSELSPALVSVAAPRRKIASSALDIVTVSATERFPATFFDPARMMTYLPGAAQVNDQANGFSIRGASPALTRYRINGLDIVNPNHLTNAGTFSDLPTGYSGGTNAISAQVMDFTQLHKGNQPFQYGNASAGLVDVNYRNGNNERQEYALQAGLIGFDATLEGPWFPGSSASYLINFRYSFTGLLADLGVDFGGEEISFSDINFNFTFPLGDRGELNLFGLVGASDNEYIRPTDSTEYEDEKALFSSIIYENDLIISGLKANFWLGKRNQITFVGGFSQANAFRRTELPGLPEGQESFSYFERLNRSEYKVSGSLSWERALNDLHFLTFGIESTLQGNDQDQILRSGQQIVFSSNFFEKDEILLQPFFNYHGQLGKLEYDLGLHHTSFLDSELDFLEPRINFQYGKFFAQAGSYSQQSPSVFLGPTRSNNIDLGWSSVLGKNHIAEVNLFAQQFEDIQTFDDPLTFTTEDQFNSLGQPIDGDNVFGPDVRARSFGIELDLQKLASKGWYYRINTTIFQAEFERNESSGWESARFAYDYLANLQLGREWYKDKDNNRSRRLGFNLGMHLNGGPRASTLDLGRTAMLQRTIYNQGFEERLAPYFRIDLRIYLGQSRGNNNSLLSLDIQNLTNAANEAYIYYDRFLEEVTTETQLGIIPVLNYRFEFGK